MATLAADAPRKYEIGDRNAYPMIAADIIYEGAFVGNSSGRARPLVAGDNFLGIAEQKVDNSAGAASAKSVRVLERGKIEMPVTGATGITDVGSSVYASDDDTLTLTSTSNTLVGKVVRHVSGTTCVVAFKATHLPD